MMKPPSKAFPALVLALVVCSCHPANSAEMPLVQIDPDKVLLVRTQCLVGANIEDLNFQLYGGLYSQLLHGECFEEQVDPGEIFPLGGPDRMAVWVEIDSAGQPVLAHFPGRAVRRLYDEKGIALPRADDSSGVAKKKKGLLNARVGDLQFKGGLVLASELPADKRRKLLELATGDRQASRHWRPVQSGDVKGSLNLTRQNVFTGNQAQEISFVSGIGEFGLDNAGLFREGIDLQKGQPYEGWLRITSATDQKLFVSLRSASGKVLAEETLTVRAAPGYYHRLTFTLIPRESDRAGRFALTLRSPGTITADYAFLQASHWGPFKDIPVRTNFAEALLSMGVKTLRYNGSMNNLCPDRLYRWKQMIGLRDTRVPYHGFFNPYASHGFSQFEFLQFCEAAGIVGLPSLNTGETDEDVADFMDYCLAGPDTVWGKRRVDDGHARPYKLNAVQIGNEQGNAEYFARLRAMAAVIWKKSPQTDVVLSCNMRGPNDPKRESIIEFIQWARSLGREKQIVLDSHYQALPDHADTNLPIFTGLKLQQDLAERLSGYTLRLWPMEENGNNHDWQRGLGHAHNLNTMNRMPLALERAGTANTFQAWDLAVIWNQGRIHFKPSEFIYQPSYYVDRLFADEWLPVVLRIEASTPGLDLMAKRSSDGKVLALYAVNLTPEPVNIALDFHGFPAGNAVATQLKGALTDHNTLFAPDSIVPAREDYPYSGPGSRIQFPAYSFTRLRLTR